MHLENSWILIYSTNEHLHRKENHVLGEQTCGCLTGEGGSGRVQELGVIRYNLEWIYKEILLSSIEKYVQILILQQNKGQGEKCIYVRITLFPCCTTGNIFLKIIKKNKKTSPIEPLLSIISSNSVCLPSCCHDLTNVNYNFNDTFETL